MIKTKKNKVPCNCTGTYNTRSRNSDIIIIRNENPNGRKCGIAIAKIHQLNINKLTSRACEAIQLVTNQINSKAYNGSLWKAYYLYKKHKTIGLVPLESMLKAGVEPNIKNSKGQTLLGAACTDGDSELVHLLLKYKANTEITSNNNWPPLWEAYNTANPNKLEIFTILLTYGANPDFKNERNKTLLQLLCTWGAGEEFVIELLKHGANPNVENAENITPLMEACANGMLNAVQVFFRHGGNLEAKDGTNWTPVWYAAFAGKLDVVKLLVAEGAIINGIDKLEQTIIEALNLEKKGCLEVKEYLEGLLNKSKSRV